MPPRRAAAIKADQANAPQPQPAAKPPSSKAKKPASTRKNSKKRVASPEPDDEEEDPTQDQDDEEESQPKKKKAKTSKSTDDTAAADDPPPKIATLTRRGTAVPVDGNSGKALTHEVLVDGAETYDAMLNQTDLNKNANKFYVLQLLHPVGNSASCELFLRWGRVGENGQSQTKGPFSKSQGINEFLKQFKSKSGATWSARRTTAPKTGKYTWIERDFGDDDPKDDSAGPSNSDKGKGKETAEAPPPPPESKAPLEVQSLLKLIFNTEFMSAVLQELNYDANKMPLGKLSKSSILQGFAVLKELSDVINNPTSDASVSRGGLVAACNTLSGNYYSFIPHAFGRNRPTPINTVQLLKRELDLVDALGDMTVASKLLDAATTDSAGEQINPLDARLAGLNLKTIEPVQRNTKEFTALETYLHDSQGATHGHLKPRVQNVFRIEREGDTEKFLGAKYDKLGDGERKLLWHGSRTTNFGGILSQGLRIAPPEAPVSGYMFGKGVYFADASSKSLGYTCHHLSRNTGLLLLCEVATHPHYELVNADYDAAAKCKQANAMATKGMGKYQPAEWKDVSELTGNEELKGVHMPVGPLKELGQTNYLWYNEYIVYDISQIRLRYLLEVKL